MRSVNRFLKMNDNNLFRHHVIEKLTEKYKMTGYKAGILVKNSSFNYMLKRDPEFVMHHSADYWAKKVYNESVPLVR